MSRYPLCWWMSVTPSLVHRFCPGRKRCFSRRWNKTSSCKQQQLSYQQQSRKMSRLKRGSPLQVWKSMNPYRRRDGRLSDLRISGGMKLLISAVWRFWSWMESRKVEALKQLQELVPTAQVRQGDHLLMKSSWKDEPVKTKQCDQDSSADWFQSTTCSSR